MGLLTAPRRPIDVAAATHRRFGRDGGTQLAASMTYYAFLSIFPLVLVGLSAVGFVLAGDETAQAEWGARLARAVPGLGPLVSDNIDAIVSGRSGAGVLGLAGLFWTGTGLANAAGYALSRVFGRDALMGFVRKKTWSVGVTVLLGSVALAGVALSGIAGGARGRGAAGGAATAAALAVAFVLDAALFLLAYRLLVPGRGPSLRALWPGALLAASGWTVLKFVGTWYASNTVARASEVYGTFATVVGVLALLYLASRLFLYGAELNVVLARGGEDMSGDVRKQIGNGRVPSQLSTPELVGGIASDVSTIVRKEVELARHEIVEAIVARVKAMGAMAGAGMLALFAAAFAGLAAADALAMRIPSWAARLVVGGAFGLLAAGAVVYGRVRMKRPSLEPEETKRTVKEDIGWARAQLKR